MKMKRKIIWLAAVCSLTMLTACGANSLSGENGGADTEGMRIEESLQESQIESKDNQASRERSASKDIFLEEQVTYQKLTPEEAKEMIDASEVIIVDVRTKEEYEESHIPNAVLIPNETIANQELEQLPDKEAVILVYCRSGRRSAQAAEKLLQLGYQNIYDFGGIIDWPYETE